MSYDRESTVLTGLSEFVCSNQSERSRPEPIPIFLLARVDKLECGGNIFATATAQRRIRTSDTYLLQPRTVKP